MFRLAIAAAFLASFVGIDNRQAKPQPLAAKCVGADPCPVCHNCEQCAYCRDGKTCGSCKPKKTVPAWNAQRLDVCQPSKHMPAR